MPSILLYTVIQALIAATSAASAASSNTPLSTQVVETSMASNDSRGLEIAIASRPYSPPASPPPSSISKRVVTRKE